MERDDDGFGRSLTERIGELPVGRRRLEDVRRRTRRRRFIRATGAGAALVLIAVGAVSAAGVWKGAGIHAATDVAGAPGRGRALLFARSVEDDGSTSNLAVVASVGGVVEDVTTDAAWEGSPAVSPDGRWVAFERQTDDGIAIVLRDVETGDERLFTDGSARATSPAWSPDGSSLAFSLGETSAEPSHVFVRDVASGELRQVTEGAGSDSDPTFSPDGSRVAFSRSNGVRSRLVIHDLESGDEVEPLTEPRRQGQPAWSPDGRRIAFVGDSGSIDNATAVYVLDLDEGEVRQLVDRAIHQGSPSWSPDGTEIALYEHSGYPTLPRTPQPMFDVFVMDADGGRLRRLTRLAQPTFPDPTWL